ncbi:MAG: cation:proton antiporter [archaeon]|jgi:Kef-type K+ transport system membrane component KefB
MINNFFIEICIIIFIAIIITTIIRLLKQPLIIGYILTGIVVSPYVLNIIKDTSSITVFSHIGVSLLLFMVGINLNPKVLKEVGKVSLFTGIGQIVFTTGIGYLICLLIGFNWVTSLYVSLALAFSSTIIIMKLLTDKGAVNSLYGKISIGFLVVQDLVAIVVLIVISSLSGQNKSSMLTNIFIGIGLVIGLLLFSIYLLPKFLKFVAKSQEFLLLFSIGWCLILAALFFYFGFSIEIGALLAGFFLSFSTYRFEINLKLKPLRDFFLILFFVLLGLQMTFGSFSAHIIPIIILSLFILIGNPLIVMIIMGLSGYKKKVGFMAGLTVAQISEFSLILIALGITAGHLTTEVLSFVTFVGLITITCSSYMIIYSDWIFDKIGKYLNIFEKKNARDEVQIIEDYNYIIFGYNKVGMGVGEYLKTKNKKFLVIDHNPEIDKILTKNRINHIYGDAGNVELTEELNLSKIKVIISTINSYSINHFLISKIKSKNKNILFIVVNDHIDVALELYHAGADYVIMPEFLCSYDINNFIQLQDTDKEKITRERFDHIDFLKNHKFKKGTTSTFEFLNT